MKLPRIKDMIISEPSALPGDKRFFKYKYVTERPCCYVCPICGEKIKHGKMIGNGCLKIREVDLHVKNCDGKTPPDSDEICGCDDVTEYDIPIEKVRGKKNE